MERLTWKQIYELWKMEELFTRGVASDLLDYETIKVDCKPGYYIYRYAWAEKTDIPNIKLDPTFELSLTGLLNKGNLHTIEMLLTAQDEEEIAAVWIAATAKELCDSTLGVSVAKYANMIYQEAILFLRTRFHVWHHAMKDLIPTYYITSSIIDSIVCKDATALIGLIRLNTLLIKSNLGIVLYSSLPENEVPNTIRNIRI